MTDEKLARLDVIHIHFEHFEVLPDPKCGRCVRNSCQPVQRHVFPSYLENNDSTCMHDDLLYACLHVSHESVWSTNMSTMSYSMFGLKLGQLLIVWCVFSSSSPPPSPPFFMSTF